MGRTNPTALTSGSQLVPFRSSSKVDWLLFSDDAGDHKGKRNEQVGQVFFFLPFLLLINWKMSKALYQAVERGDAPTVLSLLQTPGVDVNWVNPERSGWSAIHVASKQADTHILEILLSHPKIDVTMVTKLNRGVFRIACVNSVAAVKVLLRDRRVDLNVADENNCTGLWHAAYYGFLEMWMWILAERGEEVELNVKGLHSWDQERYSVLEIAEQRTDQNCALLLRRYLEDPVGTKKALRQELRLDVRQAADLFAVVVLVTDGYLRLKSEKNEKQTEEAAAVRFLSLAMRLPMELQMVLCHRVCGVAKNNIAVVETEQALRDIVWKLSFMFAE